MERVDCMLCKQPQMTSKPQTQTMPEPKQKEGIHEPLRVVTRAQAKNAQENAAKLECSQAPRGRQAEPKQKQASLDMGPTTSDSIQREERANEEPLRENMSEEQLPREGDPNLVDKSSSSRETNSGGLVLVDKINETLESILKAYEKRLTVDTVIPPKLKEYPSPIQEKVNLVKHQALIRDTQTMLEGPPPYSAGRLPMHVPNLEVIQEDSEHGTEKQHSK